MGRVRRNQRDAQRKQRAAKRRKNVKGGSTDAGDYDDDDSVDKNAYNCCGVNDGAVQSNSGSEQHDPLPTNEIYPTDDNNGSINPSKSQSTSQPNDPIQSKSSASTTSSDQTMSSPTSKITTKSSSSCKHNPIIPSGLSPIEKLRAKKQWRKQRQKEKQEARRKEQESRQAGTAK